VLALAIRSRGATDRRDRVVAYEQRGDASRPEDKSTPGVEATAALLELRARLPPVLRLLLREQGAAVWRPTVVIHSVFCRDSTMLS
jgi:hypothetical protein